MKKLKLIWVEQSFNAKNYTSNYSYIQHMYFSNLKIICHTTHILHTNPKLYFSTISKEKL